MISCMSSVLIHISYCYFIIILSDHLRSSEQLVVSRNLLIVAALGTVSSFSKLKQNISKGKQDIMEIIILLFDFWYFDIEML